MAALSPVARKHYQKSPHLWMRDRLGVRLETIDWSLIPEYAEKGLIDDKGAIVEEKWDGTPNPLLAVVKAFQTHRRIGVESATGTGKALRHGTPVLTPEGWTNIEDVETGQQVMGRDGRPTEVVGVFPQGERPIFRVTFSDGAWVECDEDHLWSVRTRSQKKRGKEFKVLTTKELSVAIRTDTWYIPELEALEFEEKNLPIHPYALGALIGDGCLRTCTPKLASRDIDLVERVAEQTQTLAEHCSDYDYNLIDIEANWQKPNRLTEKLIEIGVHGKLSYDKFIPSEYLFGSVEQRLDLLRGLLDTDGTISKKNHVSFSTTSIQLAEDVQSLVRSLGGLVSIRTKKTPSDFGICYRLTVNLPFNPFWVDRKASQYQKASFRKHRSIESIESIGYDQATCIAVANKEKLFVTKDYVPTHNTFLAACTTYWFLDVYGGLDLEDDVGCQVVTVAPKEGQLKKLLWKEIHRLWPRFQKHHPQAEIFSTEIRMHPNKPNWVAHGWPVGVGAEEQAAVRAQGFHEKYQLFITDETPGMPGSVMEAIISTNSGDFNWVLSLGNPDRIDDALHELCVTPTTFSVRISAYDHPNVIGKDSSFIPGAVSPFSIEERLARWKTEDHPLYLSRVRGICPEINDKCLFHPKAMEMAAKMLKTPIEVLKIPYDDDDTIRFRHSEGEIRFYNKPKKSHLNRYLLFADVAGDAGRGDWHVCVVYDRIARRIVAVARMRGPREDYIETIMLLADRYTVPWYQMEGDFKPLLCWEKTGVGSLIMDERIKAYPNIYYGRNIEVEDPNLRAIAGWDTSGRSRKEMVDALESFGLDLFDKPGRVVDKVLFNEMKTFVWVKKGRGGRYEHAKNKYDDFVMALGGALVVDKLIPPPRPQDKPEVKTKAHEISHFEQVRRAMTRTNDNWSDDGGWSKVSLTDSF